MTKSGQDLPPQLLEKIGAMALAAGRVESGIYEIGRALGVREPERMTVTQVAKRATRQARLEMPPWAVVDAEVVIAILQRASYLMGKRNEFLHAAVAHQYRAEDESPAWVPVAISLRDGSSRLLDDDYVRELVDLIRELTDLVPELSECNRGLLMKVREGVYAPHMGLYGPEGAPLATVYYTDGKWPDKPSDDEITEWWERVQDHSPRSWGDWPLPPVQTRVQQFLDALRGNDRTAVEEMVHPESAAELYAEPAGGDSMIDQPKLGGTQQPDLLTQLDLAQSGKHNSASQTHTT